VATFIIETGFKCISESKRGRWCSGIFEPVSSSNWMHIWQHLHLYVLILLSDSQLTLGWRKYSRSHTLPRDKHCNGFPEVKATPSWWSVYFSSSQTPSSSSVQYNRTVRMKLVLFSSFLVTILCIFFDIRKEVRSAIDITTGCRLDGRMIGVRFLAGARNFYLRHRVQTGSEAHPAPYQMGSGCSFARGKAAGTWSWPLTSI
jgi:hypothetical protein